MYRHHRAIPMVRITTCRVEFFVRRYKNSQAVAELQARIFVKDHGKGASECANRGLRGIALKFFEFLKPSSGKVLSGGWGSATRSSLPDAEQQLFVGREGPVALGGQGFRFIADHAQLRHPLQDDITDHESRLGDIGDGLVADGFRFQRGDGAVDLLRQLGELGDEITFVSAGKSRNRSGFCSASLRYRTHRLPPPAGSPCAPCRSWSVPQCSPTCSSSPG